MAGIEARDFATPDEVRTPDKTKIELVKMAGGQIGRYVFEPGWRWSDCIKPVAKTDSCQVEHIGYCISGGLRITHVDGSVQDIAAGMVYRIAPGHDGENLGVVPAVMVEFQGAANFAKS